MFLDMCVRDHPNDLRLLRHLSQDTANFLVAIDKAKLRIFEALLFGIFLHDRAGGAKIVARKAREKVMGDLQVQTSVNPLNRR